MVLDNHYLYRYANLKSCVFWVVYHMIEFLDETLMKFRSCFSRDSAFNWFVITVIGLIVRGDCLGITSIIRELGLDPGSYVTFLHFFRSSAWCLETIGTRWLNIVTESVELVKVEGMSILIGDGVKQPKEGRKMPGVKKLHQESENSTKAEYIFGHMFGVVGILAGNLSKFFCIAVSASVQDGVNKIREFADPEVTPQSHVVQLMTEAGKISLRIGPAVILLDRYFLSVPALKKAMEFVDRSGQQLLHIVTKAKMSAVAYADPPTYSGRGRPSIKGHSIKLKDLFETEKQHFVAANVLLYGKNHYLHSGVKSSIVGTTYYDGGLQYGGQKSRKIQKKNTLG
jgi:hypothetical protein